MELELLKYLEPITEEEQKYLDGKNSVEKDLYPKNNLLLTAKSCSRKGG